MSDAVVAIERVATMLSWLRAGFDEMRHEAKALRVCLADAGVLRSEAFLAQLHRERFARTLEAHPCHLSCSLPHAVEGNITSLTLAPLLGVQAVQALRAASPTLHAAVVQAQNKLRAAASRLLCVCGGTNDSREVLGTVECFDPATGSWHLLTPMAQARCRANAAIVDGCIYICGGKSATQELRSAERGSWSMLKC
eukprot:gnl/TRDRNA2_/TRDRNA2_167972_c0_seq4.p1 gnl/TRDRNA2_/TRDRNA2_167972_c0~~gnl/TRDRNA2_/TRDRNA2_167972_c0_seq4.p1  ORF type:complete len:213 (+),score=31.33 gnl/TRDRNA2_/TRDRNA2_167972_c0_seq4:53-640(+)